MLFRIKKIFIILFILFFIVGCSETSSNDNKDISCEYKYRYSCGFDVISGSTKCGMGYYYTCE